MNRVVRKLDSLSCTLGELALVLLAIQAGTGILLAAYYEPGLLAHESVRRIANEIPYGGWFRSLHWIGSILTICTALMYALSALFVGASRSPRELPWLSVSLLIVLTLAIAHTGHLLPMDEAARSLAESTLEALGSTPLLGSWLVEVTLGGSPISDVTVRRLLVSHAIILPTLLAAGLAFQLTRAKRHRTVEQPSPVLLKRLFFWGLVMFSLAAALALAFPLDIHPTAH
jgi:quinol-cytochrome oxidoreductase complex cytochrome b subunit